MPANWLPTLPACDEMQLHGALPTSISLQRRARGPRTISVLEQIQGRSVR